MDSELKTPVVLCWHMHQPSYQDSCTGEFLFPWVYLHGIKDYSDMVAHLERQPGARVVVNFAPTLLEQIETYILQIEQWRHGQGKIGDPVLAALVSQTLPEAGTPGFLDLMEKCLKANPERIIQRFPAYARLAELAKLYRTTTNLQPYIDNDFLADLLVWYHLGWMGETIRRENQLIQSLQEKGQKFTMEDRKALLNEIFGILSSIGPRYRKLGRDGQIELSVSPYSHAMIPLLLDPESAREALPEITLPVHASYPGAEQQVDWQLHHAKTVFGRFFDVEPVGCWASEGGLSQATLGFLHRHGFRWTGSGDSVLRNSLGHAAVDSGDGDDMNGEGSLHQPYTFGESDTTVFFRDDALSDLIGFTYSDWHAEDAVADLVGHMENIAGSGKPGTVISIIMDGENAWEYYPENGFHFLDELYRVLTNHPRFELTTYKDLVNQPLAEPVKLPHLVAGSWIYGTFSTWIGDPDKNRAWDLLCEAKIHFDRAIDSNTLSPDQAEAARRQLALCEGSDWFWWFGDYNPAPIVRDFEHLYRRHLVNLYNLIGYPVPDSVFQPLSQEIAANKVAAERSTMRRGHDKDATP
ncbi:glycoside hydrolase [Streptosporangium jomthongense]|uniref:Glycoside hydrolase family 57 protein n=1 Tax=Marinobacter aromaticivorans TaxID=1494078 RepID=A0ABW2IYH2_9GAMM|nr:glycoside hydrolase family 57 protein [Marinobacter aromaticivorans]GGE73552.1 glycoside hydrolase [Streptosporangium jomthongense]